MTRCTFCGAPWHPTSGGPSFYYHVVWEPNVQSCSALLVADNRPVDSPWYISARAVREFAAAMNRQPPRDDSPEWDEIERELMAIAIDCVERRSPARSESGLLRWRYRPRGGIDVKLYVSDAPRPEGPLPQLVHVAPGNASGRGRARGRSRRK